MKSKQDFILDYYGLQNQLSKLEEELGELLHEVDLFLCGHGNIAEIASETADVENMLDQIKTALSIVDEVQEIKMQKLNRQIERIKNGQ